MREQITTFVDASVAWLEQALAGPGKKATHAARQRARLIYAALQGAMTVAALKQDIRWLDEVGRSVSVA